MESKTVYICGTDWQHEIGNVKSLSLPVYTTVEEMKKNCKCWDECGIIEVEMKFVKWHEPQDYFKNIRKTKNENS